MNEWLDRLIDEWMDGRMEGWIYRLMNGQAADEQTDGWTDEMPPCSSELPLRRLEFFFCVCR